MFYRRLDVMEPLHCSVVFADVLVVSDRLLAASLRVVLLARPWRSSLSFPVLPYPTLRGPPSLLAVRRCLRAEARRGHGGREAGLPLPGGLEALAEAGHPGLPRFLVSLLLVTIAFLVSNINNISTSSINNIIVSVFRCSGPPVVADLRRARLPCDAESRGTGPLTPGPHSRSSSSRNPWVEKVGGLPLFRASSPL